MFPESLIESIPLHFLAIILGFVLIAAPQAGIIITLLPDNSPTVAADARAKAHARSRFGWALAAFSGAAMGALLAAAEFIENRSGHAPMSRVALVAALFVGSGMALLLVAYAFLREPLGLFPRERPC